jgi:sulfur carrier protein ThiS
VNGDTAGVLSGTPNETTTATSSSAPGSYPITITQGSLAAANYNFTFVNGTLTIVSGSQTISFSPVAGTYSAPQSVTIIDSDAGATIYYTTNDTTPTTSSPVFNSANPINVSVNTTIKALGVFGTSKTAVATAAYTLKVATPTFSLKAGTYLTPQSVSISDTTTDAVIWYTTDDSTPVPGEGTAVEFNGSPIAVNQNTTIKAVAAITGWTNSSMATGAYMLKVATPTFSLKAGSYLTPQSVSISDTTANAVIWYTTDDSTPVPGEGTAVQFTGTPIAVNQNTTIKAVAAVTDWTNSSTGSAAYTLKVAEPTFSPTMGTYYTTPTVSLSDTTPNAVIWYTTDGTAPVPGEGTAVQYRETPFTISETTTVKAVAAVTDWTTSSAASAVYTLKVSTPTFSPAMGSYSTQQSVIISDTNSSAAIWYTTDGTTPVPGEGTAVQYNGTPVAVSETTTVKAVAALTGWTTSMTASATYTLKLPTPTFSPAAGTYTSGQSVTISDTNSSAVIWYTTDNTAPVAGGGGTTQQYSGAISVTSTTTIKAIAALTGWTTSSMATGTFTIR